jgi:hypothetical protein
MPVVRMAASGMSPGRGTLHTMLAHDGPLLCNVLQMVFVPCDRSSSQRRDDLARLLEYKMGLEDDEDDEDEDDNEDDDSYARGLQNDSSHIHAVHRQLQKHYSSKAKGDAETYQDTGSAVGTPCSQQRDPERDDSAVDEGPL